MEPLPRRPQQGVSSEQGSELVSDPPSAMSQSSHSIGTCHSHPSSSHPAPSATSTAPSVPQRPPHLSGEYAGGGGVRGGGPHPPLPLQASHPSSLSALQEEDSSSSRLSSSQDSSTTTVGPSLGESSQSVEQPHPSSEEGSDSMKKSV